MPNQQALLNVDNKLLERTRARARAGWETNKRLHRDAPRGGANTNKFGSKRSTPGGPPAPEEGRLFARIDQSFERTGRGRYQWESNYAVLEDGSSSPTRVVPARPLRRITIAQMKAEASG